jgi:hypothetical protein
MRDAVQDDRELVGWPDDGGRRDEERWLLDVSSDIGETCRPVAGPVGALGVPGAGRSPASTTATTVGCAAETSASATLLEEEAHA